MKKKKRMGVATRRIQFIVQKSRPRKIRGVAWVAGTRWKNCGLSKHADWESEFPKLHCLVVSKPSSFSLGKPTFLATIKRRKLTIPSY